MHELSAAGVSALGDRAEHLLISLSVYREPADRNAILFQAGEHDATATGQPDQHGPVPPYLAPADLAESLSACVAAGLLIVAGTGGGDFGAADDTRLYAVDRWIAGSLQERLTEAGRGAELAAAHQRAADYWRWRAVAWPQGRGSDVHDLLEARQHLFRAGASAAASELTGVICAQLHAWGELGREAELIQSTLDLLPPRSAARAGWLHELGAVAQIRRDFAEAERRFNEAAALFAALGDERGIARCQRSLGVLAQARGEYRQAERHYRQAAMFDRRAAAAEPAAAADDAHAAAQAPAVAIAAVDAKAEPPARRSGKLVPASWRHAAGPATDQPAAAGPASAGPASAQSAAGGPADTGPAGTGPATAQDRADHQDTADGRDAAASQGRDAAASQTEAGDQDGATGQDGANGQHTAAPGLESAGDTGRHTVPPGRHVRRSGQPAIVPVQRMRLAMASAARPVLPGSSSGTEPAAAPTRPVATRARAGLAKLSRGPMIGSAAGLIAAVVTAGLVLMLTAGPGPSRAHTAGAQQSASLRRQAAHWLASQLSKSATIACDPVMCTALRQAGIPAADIRTLGPRAASPAGSDVIVATAAVRAELGTRLANVYAPLVLATFGSGRARIAVRLSAPDGAAAYRKQLRADTAARRSDGLQLADSPRISFDASCLAELTGGRVDMRLLTTLGKAAVVYRLHVVAFGDAGPGASPLVPLRSAEITFDHGHPSARWITLMTSFLNAQAQPWRPTRVSVLHAAAGSEFLVIEYAAPSPLGLAA